MNELRVGTRARDIHHTHTPTSDTYASVSKDLQTYSTVLKLGNIILRNSRCVVLELGDWGSTWFEEHVETLVSILTHLPGKRRELLRKEHQEKNENAKFIRKRM